MNTVAPLNYDINCRVVSVITWTVSSFTRSLKVDSQYGIINDSSMAIILSAQTINKNIKKSDIICIKTLWILNALTVGSN